MDPKFNNPLPHLQPHAQPQTPSQPQPQTPSQPQPQTQLQPQTQAQTINLQSQSETPQNLKQYLVANIAYPIIKNPMMIMSAAETLSKASAVAEKLAFSWKNLSFPESGQCYLMFMPVVLSDSPPDGYEWPEPEKSSSVVLQDNRTVKVFECRGGFRKENPSITMVKRRFYIDNSKDVQLQLFHYLDNITEQKARAEMEEVMRANGNNAGVPIVNPGSNAYHKPMSRPMSKNPSTEIPASINIPVPQRIPIPPQIQPQIQPQPIKPSVKRGKAGIQETNSKGGKRANVAKTNIIAVSKPPPNSYAHVQLGDEDDVVTFRDIAVYRYKRNHQLLEELFKPTIEVHGSVKSITPLLNKQSLERMKDLLKNYKEESESKSAPAKTLNSLNATLFDELLSSQTPQEIEACRVKLQNQQAQYEALIADESDFKLIVNDKDRQFVSL